MIATYVDSSVLVRLCTGEGRLDAAEAAMAGVAVTSVLTAVEVPVAIWARSHRSGMDARRRDLALALAAHLLRATVGLALTAEVRAEAVAIAARSPVRSLDAIHVATAAVAGQGQRRRGNQLRFLTADRRQHAAAAARFGPAAAELLPAL